MPDVTFVSERFSTTAADDAINGSLGKDVGEWLRGELAAAGFDVGEIIAEDYGYGFWLTMEGVSNYWVTQQEYYPVSPASEETMLWLVGVHFDTGCNPFAARRGKPAHIPQIAAAIHAALTSDSSISDIEWWADSVGTGAKSPEPPPIP